MPSKQWYTIEAIGNALSNCFSLSPAQRFDFLMNVAVGLYPKPRARRYRNLFISHVINSMFPNGDKHEMKRLYNQRVEDVYKIDTSLDNVD